MSPPIEAGLAHARSLREARERQLALIAIAAGHAAARRPMAAPMPPPLSAEQQRLRAQIKRLGLCRPVDPAAPRAG